MYSSINKTKKHCKCQTESFNYKYKCKNSFEIINKSCSVVELVERSNLEAPKTRQRKHFFQKIKKGI